MNTVQRQRLLWRTAFFALFVLAPVLDLFRLDLIQGHFILFGMPWTLGLRDVGGIEASLNLVLRAFLPIALENWPVNYSLRMSKESLTIDKDKNRIMYLQRK